jgi:hypothetical protein
VCDILRTSHPHQSIEQLSMVCTHLTEIRYAFHESLGKRADDNPTRPKLCAVSLVMETMVVVIRCLGIWQRLRHRRDQHLVFYVSLQEVARGQVWRTRGPTTPHDVTGPYTTDPSPGKGRVQVFRTAGG